MAARNQSRDQDVSVIGPPKADEHYLEFDAWDLEFNCFIQPYDLTDAKFSLTSSFVIFCDLLLFRQKQPSLLTYRPDELS